MAIRFSSSNKVHIANHSDRPVYVLASPSADWLSFDAGFTVGLTIAFPPAGVNSVKSLYDIYKLLKLLGKMYSIYGKVAGALSSSGTNRETLERNYSKLQSMIRERAVKIDPWQVGVVNEKALASAVYGVVEYAAKALKGANSYNVETLNKYSPENLDVQKFAKDAGDTLGLLNPSNFLSMISAVKDLTVVVVSEDLIRSTAFDTNSDHSWIIRDHDIVRAKYGSLHQEDSEAGWHLMPRYKGRALDPDEYLEPNECIDFDWGSEKYSLVYQQDGNLVVYKDRGGNRAVPLWSSGTNGKPAWRTIMQADGNLVVYSRPEEAVWAQWAHGTKPPIPSEYQNCHLVFDKDSGNLGYFTRSGTLLSWLWQGARALSSKTPFYAAPTAVWRNR